MKRHFLWFVPAALLLGGCLAEDVMIHQVGAEGRDDYGMLGSESAVSNTSGNFLNNLSFAGDFNRDPSGVLLRLERLFSHISREEALCAMAELSLHYARSGVEPDQAVRGYLSAALYCQQYLATVDRPQEVPYSPRRLRMVRVSNLAQTEIFGYQRDRELLVKTSYQLLTLTGHPVRFIEADFRMPLEDEEIEDVELCSDYRTSKLTHVSYRFGLGVPLIWRLQGRHELWESLHCRSTETLPGTAYQLLKRLEVDENDVVVDLGCGRGTVPLVAGLAFGAKAYGIDLLRGYIDHGERLVRVLKLQGVVSFRPGDILKCEIPKASVYFFAGTCLSAQHWKKAVSNFSKAAPKGARAISLSQALPAKDWELVSEEKWPFSWGMATVFIHKRL